MKAGRALIIGGSPGGLFAANMLGIGWAVKVYERVADDLAARGVTAFFPMAVARAAIC